MRRSLVDDSEPNVSSVRPCRFSIRVTVRGSLRVPPAASVTYVAVISSRLTSLVPRPDRWNDVHAALNAHAARVCRNLVRSDILDELRRYGIL
jgi:hypothetical protein